MHNENHGIFASIEEKKNVLFIQHFFQAFYLAMMMVMTLHWLLANDYISELNNVI